MFKDRLKELREDQGMTQEKIADKLNISRSMLSNYETGKFEPNLETLILIADFFNVSLDYLLGRTKKMHNTSLKANREKLIKKIIKDIDEFC